VTAVKTPSNVGADFDEYARRWRKEKYSLEVGSGRNGVVVDPTRADLVRRAGDEWGDVAPLRAAYASLIDRFGPATGRVNVVEIGAGGGRSTAVMLEVLGDRAGDYHVVDVSPVFVEVLKERIRPSPTVHIVDDIDLSPLPGNHFDICLAQSSWSHINLYDQYRYLRELWRVLRPDGVVYVSGQFLLGVGNDWTWNRFVRRVGQIDEGVEGVYHEFTSVAAVAEMLSRLRYDICCVYSNGFIARRGTTDRRGDDRLDGPVTFPFNSSPHDFLRTGATQRYTLPCVPPTSLDPAAATAPAATAPAASLTWPRLRRTMKRVPGVRPLVTRIRRLRTPRWTGAGGDLTRG
jgi:SAM-dependent methyltransferase